MNRYHLLYFCVLLLVPVGDTALLRRLRRKVRPRRVIERRSLPLLWLCIGAGLTFANWLGLFVVVAATAIGVANRVRIEEAALREQFGSAYEEYARRSKRFLPFIL